MGSEKKLRHELAELNLLVRGLAQVSAFPSELLELISGKVESISQLAERPEAPDLTFDENGIPGVESEIMISEDFDQCDREINYSDFSLGIKEAAESLLQMPEPPVVYQMIQQNIVVQDQRKMVGISKSMTLNDRFRFQRELFGNEAQRMSLAFTEMENKASFDEALDYFRGLCEADETSEGFKDFCGLLQVYYSKI